MRKASTASVHWKNAAVHIGRHFPDKPRPCLKPQAAVLTDLNRAVASLQVYVLSMG